MSSLKLLYKLTRIEQCLMAGISTWIITLLSDTNSWVSKENIFPALCLFFACLGASLFHYGMRSEIYREKYWDQVIVKNPLLLKVLGLTSFLVTALLSLIGINSKTSLIFLTFFFLIIIFYPNRLDRHWPWKNLSIAFACTSPVIISWTISQYHHPILWPLTFGVFFFYVAREIIKDIDDQPADQGRRITMVMSIGEFWASWIALIFLFLAVIALVVASFAAHLSFFASIPYIFGLLVMLEYGRRLLFSTRSAIRGYQFLDLGILGLMIGIFLVSTGI